MVEVREVFPILADGTTGEGEPAISRIEGEPAAAIEGLIGFSFKDSSGNVVLPQLTADGKVPVDTEGVAGVCLTAEGEITAGGSTLADIATITGQLVKTYQKFGFILSCFRSSLFQLQYIDDSAGTPVTNILARVRLGPGQFTICCEISCLQQSTAAGTGVQEFKVQGRNVHPTSSPVLSALSATVAVSEV